MDKEISLVDAIGVLQTQVKGLVKVIRQQDEVIKEQQKILDIICKNNPDFQRLF